MRNHPEVKKWMYNQETISKKDHSIFINRLEGEIVRRYFLVKHNSVIIGSINFSQIKLHNSVELGIYKNLFLNKKNSGDLLISAASKYAFVELKVKKIKLEVFSNNKHAINFYKKHGFSLINVKNLKYQNILYMQKTLNDTP